MDLMKRFARWLRKILLITAAGTVGVAILMYVSVGTKTDTY